jgi:hypothetical protein
MASPQWHDRLRQELRRQGLPSEYISRLVEELSDHATDLSMENSSMDAEQVADVRLGSPEQLATFAKSEFQRSTFAGRHPLWTFVAGPIFAIIGTLTVVCLVAFGAAWLIDTATGGSLSANDELGLPPSSLEMGIMRSFNTTVRFVPFVFSAWLFVRLGRRAELQTWSIGACGIIALAAIFFSSVLTPATAQAKATWMIGVGWKLGFDQILQAAVPFALGAWLIWQHSTNQAGDTACVVGKHECREP